MHKNNVPTPWTLGQVEGGSDKRYGKRCGSVSNFDTPGKHRKVPFFLGNWIAGFLGVSS